MNIPKKIKSSLTRPLTRFLKNLATNPKNYTAHKKRYLLDKSFGKKEFIPYIPDSFGIHITFRCTLRCPACLYLLKDENAFTGGMDMSLEKFNWILEKFKKDIKMVSIGGGEPTLHPQFSEIVRSVKSRNFRLGMSTNGTLITKRISDLKHFDKINVSLDGVDYQSFKKLRNGTKEQYKNIIDGLHLLKNSKIPFNLSFLLFEENLFEINRILEFAERLGPAVLNLHSGNPHGSQSWTPLVIDSPKVQNFLREILKRNDYSFSIKLPVVFNPNSKSFYKQSCPLLWQATDIHWNGDMAYCCHLKPDPKIGNIFHDYNFNNPQMVKFRKAMIDRKFSEDCLYCQRRFLNNFSGYFGGKNKKWFIPSIYEKFRP